MHDEHKVHLRIQNPHHDGLLPPCLPEHWHCHALLAKRQVEGVITHWPVAYPRQKQRSWQFNHSFPVKNLLHFVQRLQVSQQSPMPLASDCCGNIPMAITTRRVTRVTLVINDILKRKRKHKFVKFDRYKTSKGIKHHHASGLFFSLVNTRPLQ